MNSIPPDPLTKLETMIAALSDAVAKGNDRITEVIVEQRSQKGIATSQQSLLLNVNQRLTSVEDRLTAVEAKAEHTARQQDEAEGGLLRETANLSHKVATIAAETKKHLAAQDEKLDHVAGQCTKLTENDKLQNVQLATVVKYMPTLESWQKVGVAVVIVVQIIAKLLEHHP